jgi:hypothetical protein
MLSSCHNGDLYKGQVLNCGKGFRLLFQVPWEAIEEVKQVR